MLKGNKRTLLIGGLAAFAIVYFNKLENREKAKTQMKNTKTKVSSYMESQKHKPSLMTKTAFSDPQDPDDNRMIEEGAMTSIQYYNENVQDKKSKFTSESKEAYPKSHKKAMPIMKESLPEDNNDSPAKQQNHTELEGTKQK